MRASLHVRFVVVGCLCVLAIATAAGAVGTAAYRAIRLQTQFSQSISLLAEIPAIAGRVEALVAALADENTNPAERDAMRAELSTSADRLSQIENAISEAPRTGGGAGPGQPSASVDEILRSTVRRSSPSLDERLRSYADGTEQAAEPDAQLAPGMLVRGSLDGEYDHLIEGAAEATAGVRAEETASLDRWRAMVLVGVLSLAGAGLLIAILILGPLAAVVRRNRAREDELRQEQLDAAAYLAQVVDGIDVGVIAVDQTADRLTINAAGRVMLGVAADAEVTDLLGLRDTAGLWHADDEVPVPEAEMPLSVALAGREFPATELRLVPAESTSSTPQRRVMVRASPLRSRDGRRLGALATFQDVTELHLANRLLSRKAVELAAISHATRAVLREENARDAVCHSAAQVSGAVLVGLFEPDGHGDLVCTSAVGADMVGLRIPQDSRSVLADVFSSSRARTVARTKGHTDVAQDVVSRVAELSGQPVASGAWIPVVSAGRCRAVLALGFAGEVDASGHVPVLEILAAETAVAIERQDLLRRLETEAGTDPLTGLANRRAWDDALREALDEARTLGRAPCVIILDLDHFKAYNDAHGHPAGDALLREVAGAWRSWLRPYDVLARFGGEEFIVLLPDCTPAEGTAVATALRELMINGQTCSAGLATWDRTETSGQLIARADAALYVAKDQGRDRSVVG